MSEAATFSSASLSSADDEAQPKSRYFTQRQPSTKHRKSSHSSSSTSTSLSDHHDPPIDVSISAEHYTKLEVLDARQISELLRWFTGGIILGAAISISLLILIHVQFKVETPAFTVNNPPAVYELIIAICKLFLVFIALVLLVLYAIRIGRLAKRDRTHQQIWVLVLLVSTLLYINPYLDILSIIRYGRAEDFDQGNEFLTSLYFALRQSAFTFATIAYIWASVHSYGLLKAKKGFRFYVTKAVLILGYLIVHFVLLLYYQIRTSELPLTSLFTMLAVYKIRENPNSLDPMSDATGSNIPTYIAVSVSILTAYEVILLILIIRRIASTKKTLVNVDYLSYRTNQIGFRFFLYNSLNFYIVFWIFHIVSSLALPPDPRLLSQALGGELLLNFQLNTLGLEVMLLVYAGLETYVNLPADAIGFRGWIYPRAKPGNFKPGPITYRKLEPSVEGKRPLGLQNNCFVMQTHVEMFNWAWLVYYDGTPKYHSLKQTRGLFSYSIEGSVHNDDTDSHALVIDGSDRIVVAFKGTNSVRNLRTDLQAFHMNCSRVIPTRLSDGEDFESSSFKVQKTMSSNEFNSAKFHKGFARAYMSISKEVMTFIKRLHDRRPRPIYLTGHSLGGALAAIASFDLYLKMGLGPNDVFVSSFGAPRVGNSAFRKLYNDRVPHHWRIVIGPDVVTKLPKVGYQHVGKKVLLTAAGELFIDPNALEMKHWHGDPASLLYHRKASYLLAMKAWCNKHHRETYEPHFWAFPINYEDSRRFPSAVRKTARDASREGRRRIMSLDAMVDALDRKKRIDVSEYALSNWQRLTRRALLNEEFRLRMT